MSEGGARAGEAAAAARRGHIAEALELDLRGLDRVTAAMVRYRSGDVVAACRQLGDSCDSDSASERCRAAAGLIEVELDRGNPDVAASVATTALERDRASSDESSRARLHLAVAANCTHHGRRMAARAALSRAASCAPADPGLIALIAARRARGLAARDQLADAESALDRAERLAVEADALAVAAVVARYRADVLARRGNTAAAEAILRRLVDDHRLHGDEIGAIRAEIDLARVWAGRGRVSSSAVLASAAGASAACRRLVGLATQASVIGAAVHVAELRLDSALPALNRLLDSQRASADVRATARHLLDEVGAWTSGTADYSVLERHRERDEIELGLARARIAMAADDPAAALDAVRDVAVRAERSRRSADLADALALAARLHVARGDAASAAIAAARALSEAVDSGMLRAQADALLVLAALQRDKGNTAAASCYARHASTIAVDCGLPVERLVAAEALAELACTPSHGDSRHPIAATMTATAVEAADRVRADLGLAAVRPYRVVRASGAQSLVAGANPDVLRMTDRTLAIDGVRDVVIRGGEQIADLRRRSLLKRLLFLFAGAPGQLYTKEEIVQTVWNVEYHPLNRDAALFTNIMRVRRLLGADGAELIRASDGGYRFTPPEDYLFVEHVATDRAARRATNRSARNP